MIHRRTLLATATLVPAIALAQEKRPANRKPSELPKLPANAVTHHTVALAGRTLNFTATAGALPVLDQSGETQAEICFVAYTLDGVQGSRPVSFAVNGGPGAASAWLQLGALGPWRVDMSHPLPSQPPALMPNPDTWLDFTDLVFLDPPGTGFSSVTDEARKHLFSVRGDIDALAVAIRRWMVANKRFGSPVYLVGESYGGFRAPRLAQALADHQGVGAAGMVLVSPALDLTDRHLAFNPLSWAVRLPVLVAAHRAQDGRVQRAQLADAEAYALTDYLAALLQGERNPQALARMEQAVAGLTGLDPEVVRRLHGRVGRPEVLREIGQRSGAVPSPYDVMDSVPDPFPAAVHDQTPDAVLDALQAPVAGAMLSLYGTQLNWMVDRPYQLLNGGLSRQWDWGDHPESVTALRQNLALDGKLRVLVAHGLFDLVTPWLYTTLLLDQIPGSAGASRVTLSTYPAGHMVYTDNAGRAGLRTDALQTVFA